jgi:predicted RNA methylase
MNVSTEVLTILSTALRFDGIDRAAIVVKLERNLYVAVDKILQGLGGKWNRKAKAHIFTGEERPEDAVERVLATGRVTIVRDDLAFFPTPPEVAEQLVHTIGVAGQVVLEPSAGRGALVDACLAGRAREVWCVERDPVMRESLREKYGAKGRGPVVHVSLRDDFMEYEGDMGYVDRVIMNPPFKKIGLGDHLDHVLHAHRRLAPGSGKLAAIMPNGVVFREDKRHKAFREAVYAHGGYITELPEGSFKPVGTAVRTCIVTMNARKS